MILESTRRFSRLPLLPAAAAFLAAALLLGCLNPTGGPRLPPENVVKISAAAGGFDGVLGEYNLFGYSAAAVEDLDGDGVAELAVGAPYDAASLVGGAVWLLFLDTDRTVKSSRKIGELTPALAGALHAGDGFGRSVAAVEDLDGDGVAELAVGAPYDDEGGTDRGAVWLLFLDDDGTVKSARKISSASAALSGKLRNFDIFGRSVACLGDLDGNGAADLAVGACWDDDGGPNRGAVWLLFLDDDGTVESARKISSDPANGFPGTLNDQDWFGVSLACIGDLDDDSVPDLAVGAMRDDDSGADAGAVWTVRLNDDGTVKAAHKFAAGEGELFQGPTAQDYFGISAAGLGDLNVDGVPDIAVGAIQDDGGASGVTNDFGAIWLMFLKSDGTLKSFRKISNTQGGLAVNLDRFDHFGSALTCFGDYDHDLTTELAVGACKDDDGGHNYGSVRILALNPDGTVE